MDSHNNQRCIEYIVFRQSYSNMDICPKRRMPSNNCQQLNSYIEHSLGSCTSLANIDHNVVHHSLVCTNICLLACRIFPIRFLEDHNYSLRTRKTADLLYNFIQFIVISFDLSQKKKLHLQLHSGYAK